MAGLIRRVRENARTSSLEGHAQRAVKSFAIEAIRQHYSMPVRLSGDRHAPPPMLARYKHPYDCRYDHVFFSRAFAPWQARLKPGWRPSAYISPA